MNLIFQVPRRIGWAGWLAIVLPAVGAWAQEPSVVTLEAPAFSESGPGSLRLESGWRFKPGDDLAWADPDYDDSAWSLAGSTLAAPSPESGWQGVGWYRLCLRRSPDLELTTLGYHLVQGGASEIYLDGVLLERHGEVGSSIADEVALWPQWPQRPGVLPLASAGEHVLAVRYSNFAARSYRKYRSQFGEGGFQITVVDFDRSLRRSLALLGGSATQWKLWAGAALAFAVLHLFLFAYRPEEQMNLYFVVVAASFAGLVGGIGLGHEASDPVRVLLLYRAGLICGITMILGFTGLIHANASSRWKPLLKLVGGVGLAGAVWAWFMPHWLIFQVFALLAVVVMLPAGLLRSPPGNGGWILALGSIAAGLTGGLQILSDWRVLGLEPRVIYPYGMLFLLLTVSIYLGRRFADTHTDLAAQVVQVRKLSDQALEQERRGRQQEIERRLLEADNARKTAELERARKLQLSLLPRERPEVPGLEVRFEMRAAREVGGDYCDYVLAPGGSFTLALGDATGHGLDAAMVVMATKSLFQAVPGDSDVLATLERIARGIESMRLRRMNMALALLHFQDGRVSYTSAGMPPLLVYRAARDEVEELELRAPPLGTIRGHRYRARKTHLEPGDSLLLTTDGLPEMLGPGDEMLGYEALRRRFSRLASGPADEVLGGLFDAAADWADGRAQEDDMTLVFARHELRQA